MVYVYNCNQCGCSCKSKYDYDRHCQTRKHKIHSVSTNSQPEIIYEEDELCACVCGKTYKQRSSLSKHRKMCDSYKDIINQRQHDIIHVHNVVIPHPIDGEMYNASNNIHIQHDSSSSQTENMIQTDIVSMDRGIITPEFIMSIVRQNQDLKNLLIEQREEYKEQMNVIMNSNQKNREELKNMLEELAKPTTIVNNNTQFNLNIFLNEKCKHAISLTQFVNSLDVGPHNVEYTGVHGYVAGITKIFMDGLRQLDVHERPIHCTDLKREILYIKEDDTWEKDSPEKTKLKKALSAVVRKNMQQLRAWMSENPRCEILDTNEYHLHLNIMRQCIGGDVSQEDANNRKIIRNIAKEVVIDRTKL
jgi:hypothetical protein